MNAEALLADLVGFPTVVGTSNLAIMDHIRNYLGEYGISCRVLPGPEGDRANLFATIGDPSAPGYILSGHVDVVPAGEPEWKADPFILRKDGEKLIGRGSCDMKGFVAAVLSAVPKLSSMPLKAPIHIALSYDEEAGCKGVPHMLSRLPELCAPALGAIIGEPTGLVPVLAHKGKAAIRIAAHGVSGHSSRPDLGVNAIHKLLPALLAATRQADKLQSGPQDARFAPPYSSLQIGTVTGGQAINIIPDRAEARIEARAIAGVDPNELLLPLIEAAKATGLETETLSSYPALALDQETPLAALAEDISGNKPLGAVSFGTEAGLFQQAGVASVICGPGDISRAHRPEEYLTATELEGARQMVLRLGSDLAG